MVDTPQDKRLFEELYREYKQYMFKVASFILEDENLAEDAVNEAFLRIAKNFEKFKANLPDIHYGESIADCTIEKINLCRKEQITCPKTRAYVVVIIRRVALNMREKQKRGHEVLMDDPSMIASVNNMHGAEPSAAEEYENKVQRQAVLDAVSELSDTVRETLYLNIVQQLSPEEIAYITEVKVDTVYKRLQRGKDTLAAKLKDKI